MVSQLNRKDDEALRKLLKQMTTSTGESSTAAAQVRSSSGTRSALATSSVDQSKSSTSPPSSVSGTTSTIGQPSRKVASGIQMSMQKMIMKATE